ESPNGTVSDQSHELRPPLLTDLHVQFWDIRKQTCLQTISNAESAQSPNDTLNRILFLPASLT
ncbi:hypothetical protein HDU83_008292, partial [Entophlyctis luteolus]